jgi:hypothetical protein
VDAQRSLWESRGPYPQCHKWHRCASPAPRQSYLAACRFEMVDCSRPREIARSGFSRRPSPPEWADAGGLISYGTSAPALARRAVAGVQETPHEDPGQNQECDVEPGRVIPGIDASTTRA